jgi:Mg2+/Co2+ transporter CorB
LSDDYSLSLLFGLLIFLLIFSAFASSTETAFMVINRYRLKHKAMSGNRAAMLTEKILEQPDKLISLILLINNITHVSAASVVTIISLQLGGDSALVLGSLLLTFFLLIFTEITPKTFAAKYPSEIALPASFIYYPLLKFLGPLIYLVSRIPSFILGLFGANDTEAKPHALNSAELKAAVTESGHYVSNDNQQMLLAILDLDTTLVENVMVPRQEIIGIDLEENWEDCLQVLRSTKFSRIPVYRDDINDLIGVIRVRDVLSDMTKADFNEEILIRKLQPPYFVPESTPLNNQLLNFKKFNNRFSFIVDEYGDIQGLITIEDVIREVIGEINQVTENDDLEIKKENATTYLIDAGISIKKLNRLLLWSLPNEGQSTINGLILEKLGEIPSLGSVIKINVYSFEIIDKNDQMIKSVRVTVEDQNS